VSVCGADTGVRREQPHTHRRWALAYECPRSLGAEHLGFGRSPHSEVRCTMMFEACGSLDDALESDAKGDRPVPPPTLFSCHDGVQICKDHADRKLSA
jgi:hypothetical protein